MALMIPLCTLHTHGHLVFLAEHRQRLVVLPAQVVAGKRGRLRQPVSLQRWIPPVCREVELTVGRLAHEARLDGCRLVSLADIAGDLFAL